eukprot:TRINITY_DN4257_c0_g1_i1.p1 TRINITY_DN4257_c0_g1~~TRINITY_DN4257_c0_g1_i1.p1  ORF type:complete len:697 (-),score=181.05 TRINITY_DN4257_c0_g1_i1:177-2267(-)
MFRLACVAASLLASHSVHAFDFAQSLSDAASTASDAQQTATNLANSAQTSADAALNTAQQTAADAGNAVQTSTAAINAAQQTAQQTASNLVAAAPTVDPSAALNAAQQTAQQTAANLVAAAPTVDPSAALNAAQQTAQQAATNLANAAQSSDVDSLIGSAQQAASAVAAYPTAAVQGLAGNASAALPNVEGAIAALKENASAELEAAKEAASNALPAADATAAVEAAEGLLPSSVVIPSVDEAVSQVQAAASSNVPAVSSVIEQVANAAEQATAALDSSCATKVSQAAKAFGECAVEGGDAQICTCVDAMNMSIAACDHLPLAKESATQALSSYPAAKLCAPAVEEGGTAAFAEIKGSLKLSVQDSDAFAKLKNKGLAVSNAMAKVVGVAPQAVSAVLFPWTTTSRRLQQAGTWFANYTITAPATLPTTPQALASRVASAPADQLASTLQSSFMEQTGVSPQMAVEPLPVEVNSVVVTTLAPSAPSQIVPAGYAVGPETLPFQFSTTAAPSESWWDAHWLYIVFGCFIVALCGVCFIAASVLYDHRNPKKSKNTRAIKPSPAARMDAPMVSTTPSTGGYSAPIPTQVQPLPTYNTAPMNYQGQLWAPEMHQAQMPTVQAMAPPANMAQMAAFGTPQMMNRGMMMPGMQAQVPMGQPSAAEVAARASALFDMLDTNHDGTVSRQELAALMARQGGMM